jgi:SAM-dependent methyltransferase
MSKRGAYDDAFARMYDKYYPDFARAVTPMILDIVREFRPDDAHPVIELCCGPGILVAALAEADIPAVGVDLSETMLSIAEGNLDAASAKLARFEKADVFGDFDSGPAGVAVASNAALNYAEDCEALARCFGSVGRSLAPGGLLIGDVVTVSGLQNATSLMVGDEQDRLVVIRGTFDEETATAYLQLSGFFREGEAWTRFNHMSRQHYLTQDELDRVAEAAGLVPAHDDHRFKILFEALEGFRRTGIAYRKP